MTVNIGTIDRIARIVLGIALIAFALALALALALGFIAPGTSWSWVGWIGVLPILTALIGNCPAYSVFGCSTR